jgi:hypothetical protein
MLMVVFGAGASYDSVPSIPIRAKDHDRPPLANQLFDTRPAFKATMARFRRCLPIIPYLQDQHAAVERVLETLREEAKDHPERYRQLAAIRYYLQYALWELEHRWNNLAQGVSNYKTLLDQIQRWRKPGQEVCFATFNYDTMLEAALPTVGINIQSMYDYVKNKDYKLIKLHGSVNWGREIAIDIINKNPGSICDDIIDQAPNLAGPNSITPNYSLVTGPLIGKFDGKVLYPALAIPVETKLSFECPEQHLETLRQCARRTNKLLVVGWRGMEEHFLALLAEYLPPGISIVAVNGTHDEGKQTVTRISRAGVNIDSSNVVASGFSDFIVRRIGDSYLSS